MSVWTSYDTVGLAEDVSDVISNISPTKTPFQSSISNEKIPARIHEWQEDALRSVQDNKQLEGFTASEASLSATTMRSNYTQILEKTIKVSATADAVKKYGRAKETAYQLAKASEEVKRDLEYAFVAIDNDKVTGDATTAREMASALFMIDSSAQVITDSDASATTANVAGPLTEANVLALHLALYNNGADPDTLMVKPADAQVVAGFAAVSNQRTRDFGTGQRVVNSVDVYVSPWGELRIVKNRFINSGFALMYDPENWRKLTLRPWTRTMLAKTGDNEMHMLVGEFSLKHANFKASGTIENLT
jgi:hypothetical protein